MKIKVLVISPGPLVKRGVESYLLNLYKYIDHQKIAVDFLTPFTCENERFTEETKLIGDSVVELKLKNNKLLFPIRFYKRLSKYLKNNNYDTVYINTGNVFPMAIAAKAASKTGIKNRIVHSHNGGVYSAKNRILKAISTHTIRVCPTSYLACSKLAAEFVFPKECVEKTIVVPNGIELEKYRFNPDLRNTLRKEYGLDDCCVVGHVGAFIEQKNHTFILDIAREIKETGKNVKFVLIGEGPFQEKTKNKVKEYGLESSFKFVGRSDCVEAWLCAFDIFILPSIFEGLPVSAVEAQASGLPCILSDTITGEVDLTEDVFYLSINNGAKLWADKINQFVSNKRKAVVISDRLKTLDVKETARIIEKQLTVIDYCQQGKNYES